MIVCGSCKDGPGPGVGIAMATTKILLSLLSLSVMACVPTVKTSLKQALPSVLGESGVPLPCWREAGTVALPGPVQAATFADLDRNGTLDLVAITTTERGRALFFAFNSGDGDLSRTTSLELNGAPVAIAAADVNLDGSVDLLVASGPASPSEPSALHVLLGDGAGGFIAGATPLPFYPAGLVVVDIDGNDVLDAIVLGSKGKRLVTLTSDGRGEFEIAEKVRLPGGITPERLAFADFDGDRLIDMATLHDRSGDRATLTLHQGKGGDFRPWMRIEVGRSSRALAASDINRDGNADLVALTERSAEGGSPSAVLLLGNGASEPDFLGIRYFGPADAASLQLVDVNGDGYADVLAPRAAGDGIEQLPADRRGGLGKLSASPLPAMTDTLLVGDLNRDGRPELLSLSSGRASGSILAISACDAESPAT